MENIEKIREQVDFLEVASLSRQIQELAGEAANLSQRLASEELSDSDKEDLGSKLVEVVNRGSELSEKMAKVFAKY